MIVTRLVTATEVVAAVVVSLSAVALLLMIPPVLSAIVKHRAMPDRKTRRTEEAVERMLAASVAMSTAVADVDRLAVHAVHELPEAEAAHVLRRTARQLSAGAEALAGPEGGGEDDDEREAV